MIGEIVRSLVEWVETLIVAAVIAGKTSQALLKMTLFSNFVRLGSTSCDRNIVSQ